MKIKCLYFSEDVKLVQQLPICHCGTPKDCYNWLIEYLTDLNDKNWDKYDYNDENWKFIQIINGFLENLDFVEHGTTCRCSWLTTKGKKLLEILKYMQQNDFDFNPDENTEYGKWFWVVKEE